MSEEKKEQQQPLPPVALGITLGVWIAVMLTLAFVVVPTVFATCTGAS